MRQEMQSFEVTNGTIFQLKCDARYRMRNGERHRQDTVRDTEKCMENRKENRSLVAQVCLTFGTASCFHSKAHVVWSFERNYS